MCTNPCRGMEKILNQKQFGKNYMWLRLKSIIEINKKNLIENIYLLVEKFEKIGEMLNYIF